MEPSKSFTVLLMIMFTVVWDELTHKKEVHGGKKDMMRMASNSLQSFFSVSECEIQCEIQDFQSTFEASSICILNEAPVNALMI